MSYGEHSGVSEMRAYRSLYDLVGVVVDRGSRFVQYKYSRLAQQCSGQANQLSLTHTSKIAKHVTINYK